MTKRNEERGGYGAGKPLKLSDVPPPPRGPAPGAPASPPLAG